MDQIKNIMKANPCSHAYVLRAIDNKCKGFEISVSQSDELSYFARWNDENMITLYGEYSWCKEFFTKYYKYFDFYDLQVYLGNQILTNKPSDFNRYYVVEEYLLMKKTVQKSDPSNHGNKHNNIALLKKSEIENTINYCLVDEYSACIGTVSMDKIMDSIFVLCALSVNADKRCLGYGTFIVNEIIRLYKGNIILLYVNKENETAINIYKRLGFEIFDEYLNFKLKDKAN